MSKYIKNDKAIRGKSLNPTTGSGIIRQEQKKNNFSMLLFMSIMILSTIMPLVSRAISATITTYALMFVMAYLYLAFFIGVKGQESGVYVKAVLTCLPLFMLELLNQLLFINAGMLMWGYHWLLMVLPIFMGLYILQNDDKFAASIGKVYFGALFITVITTIIGLYQNPFAARLLATVTDTNDSYFITLNWKNIGGYAFVYMMVLLYPMIICAYKQKRIKTWQMAVIVVLLAWLYIKAEYVTAILLFIMSSTLLFAKRNLKFRSVVLVFLGALLLFFIFYPLIADLLYNIADNVSSLTIGDRIRYMADELAGKDSGSQVGNRSEVLLQSLTMFLKSPFIGTFLSKESPGGHSFILDILARYGLMGAGALAVLYTSVYRIFYLPLKNKPYYGYMIFSFIQVILLSTVNTGDWLFVLALGIPLTVKFIEARTKKGAGETIENSLGN